MSWLSGIAGKAENILNSLDQSASEALSNPNGNGNGHSNSVRAPSRQDASEEPCVISPAQFAQPGSMPRNASGYLASAPAASHISTPTGRRTPSYEPPGKRKDRDEELLDFLNSGSVPQVSRVSQRRVSDIYCIYVTSVVFTSRLLFHRPSRLVTLADLAFLVPPPITTWRRHPAWMKVLVPFPPYLQAM